MMIHFVITWIIPDDYVKPSCDCLWEMWTFKNGNTNQRNNVNKTHKQTNTLIRAINFVGNFSSSFKGLLWEHAYIKTTDQDLEKSIRPFRVILEGTSQCVPFNQNSG